MESRDKELDDLFLLRRLGKLVTCLSWLPIVRAAALNELHSI